MESNTGILTTLMPTLIISVVCVLVILFIIRPLTAFGLQQFQSKKKPWRVHVDGSVDDCLRELFQIINQRKNDDPEQSYIARHFARGQERMAQKVGEEAVETVIAYLRGSREDIVDESADLLFHLLMLWASASVEPEDVFAELMRRKGISGLEEKATRKSTKP